MKNTRLAHWCGGLFTVFCLDRITKWLAMNVLPAGGWFIWPHTVGLQLQRNQGIAYGIPLPSAVLVILVAIILIVMVWFVGLALWRSRLSMAAALGLIIFGAFSNLLDRLHYGYVADLFVISRWMVFNLADLMITMGAIWLVILFLKKPNSV